MSNHLTSEQRYEIYLGIKRFWSKSRIAREINVHPSTVIREIRRNSNASGEYVWLNAQRKCDGRRHGLKGNHRKPPELWWRIEQMILTEDWSPSQIAGVLGKEGIHIVRQDHLQSCPCRQHRQIAPTHATRTEIYKKMQSHTPHQSHQYCDRVSIHQRPAEADGTRLGDWEMDTIVDSYGHAILTLTERSTNFILMEKLEQGRKALPTARVVCRLLFPYRESLKTITTDNGCEFAAHLEISKKLSIKGKDRVVVYFADSYASWQKGTVENANKLIRKYIPKKANFDEFSHKRIMNIQKKLNRRPREKLNFDTPINCFFKTFH